MKPKANIDWAPVRALVIEDMRHIEERGDHIKDIEQYMYEALLEAVYGPRVWAYLRALPESE